MSDMKTLIEAAELACPLSFAGHSQGRIRGAACLGDKCMFWRWDKMPAAKMKSLVVDENLAGPPDGYFDDDFAVPPKPEGVPEDAWFEYEPCDKKTRWTWVETSAEIAARRGGWCGLAGRPD